MKVASNVIPHPVAESDLATRFEIRPKNPENLHFTIDFAPTSSPKSEPLSRPDSGTEARMTILLVAKTVEVLNKRQP
jgi:hypothetical protein